MLTVFIFAALGVPGCGDDRATTGPFELSIGPEFVNMVIPGRRPVALVTAMG